MRTVRVVVRGRVQGVGYRWTVQRAAERHGVRGWVANRGDGSVEAVLSGTGEAVAAVLDVMGDGPTHAVVTALEVVDGAEEPPDEGFRIAR